MSRNKARLGKGQERFRGHTEPSVKWQLCLKPAVMDLQGLPVRWVGPHYKWARR